MPEQNPPPGPRNPKIPRNPRIPTTYRCRKNSLELSNRFRILCVDPLGTWVAVEFGENIFPGTITKLYPGEDLCEVVFTDGDKADYEADQITYAKQLYEAKFRPREE